MLLKARLDGRFDFVDVLHHGFDRIARGILEDKLEAKQAMGLMGVLVTSAIQEQIANGVPPPNAEETIDRKGSSTPLINHGQLRQSIAYEVREK
jgi:hypothetical protein